jgi:hypothetical protein
MKQQLTICLIALATSFFANILGAAPPSKAIDESSNLLENFAICDDDAVREEVLRSFSYMIALVQMNAAAKDEIAQSQLSHLLDDYFATYTKNVDLGIALIIKHQDTELLLKLFASVIANRGSADEFIPCLLGQFYRSYPGLFAKAFSQLSDDGKQVIFDNVKYGIFSSVNPAERDKLIKGLDALKKSKAKGVVLGK